LVDALVGPVTAMPERQTIRRKRSARASRTVTIGHLDVKNVTNSTAERADPPTISPAVDPPFTRSERSILGSSTPRCQRRIGAPGSPRPLVSSEAPGALAQSGREGSTE